MGAPNSRNMAHIRSDQLAYDERFCPICTRRFVLNPFPDPALSVPDPAFLCTCNQDLDSSAPPSPAPPSRAQTPPSTIGKPRTNEKRAAVLEVRRCAKVFLAEYNLQFPSCMESMRYHPPNSIYKALDLDKALMNNIVDNAEEAGRGRETAKLKYGSSNLN